MTARTKLAVTRRITPRVFATLLALASATSGCSAPSEPAAPSTSAAQQHTQQATTAAQEQPTQTADPCDPERLSQDLGFALKVLECANDEARVQSINVGFQEDAIFHHDHWTTAQPREHLGHAGLVRAVRTYEGNIMHATQLGCDGRGILIVDTYNADTTDPQAGLATALAAHPGALFTLPGQPDQPGESGNCQPLTSPDERTLSYPIFYDYGSDTEALCNAQQQQGGTAQILSEAAPNPCP